MPFITGTWPPAAYLIGVVLPEFATPFADGFIGDRDTPGEEHFLDIAVAEDEPEVEPDGMRDDFWGKAVVFVAFRVGRRRHVGDLSGSVGAHTRVGNGLIMPLDGRARDKLSKPPSEQNLRQSQVMSQD